MSTDPFIEAALAEAERVFPNGVNRTYNKTMRETRAGFIAGARWTRDHLAAQEPTDALPVSPTAEDYTDPERTDR